MYKRGFGIFFGFGTSNMRIPYRILHLRSVNRQKFSPAALDMSDSEFSAMVQPLCRLAQNCFLQSGFDSYTYSEFSAMVQALCRPAQNCNNVIRAPSVLARALHLSTLVKEGLNMIIWRFLEKILFGDFLKNR